MLGVGKALFRLRKDTTHPGAPGCPVTSPDVDDDEWLPAVGAAGWAVIMRDKKVRTRPWEREALIEHAVIAFVLTGMGQASNWEQMRLLVRYWDSIEDSLAHGGPGPRVHKLTSQGVGDLYLPGA